MKNLKRFTVVLLVVCSVFILASCKSCKPQESFKEIPSISNADNAFLQIGDYKVTNKEVYHQLLNSYGLETLLNKIDDAILPQVENEADFQEYLEEIIYGDEEKTDEVLNEYLDSLTLSGLSTNPEDENYYVNYHKLIYRRIQFAKDFFKSEMTDETFTEDDKKETFESNFHKNNDLIVIRFNSQNEANTYLSKNNIDLAYLNTGWQNTEGVKLETAQVQATFENIYKEVNNVTTSGVKTYTYTDLTTINSTLANTIYYYTANEYTKVPTTFGSYVYLIYKVSETGNLDSEGNTVTYEEKLDEIIDILVDANVSNTYATMVSLENQRKHNLKIYDFGLETLYKTSYNSVYEALKYEEDEYEAFKTTDEESTTVVFSYEVNGKTVNVTADEIFNTLNHKYGNYVASLYLKQYVVLIDNPVYNIITGEILNTDKYNSYYKTDVTEYKEAFNDGDYESLGYPSSYGWENFIRDYLGLLSEEKILLNLDSSLYEECLETYKEQFYLQESTTDEEGNTISEDQKVQDKMEEIFNNYVNATAIGIKAYYDNNYDATADEFEANSSQETLIKELIATVYQEVLKKDSSIDTALKEIVLEYNISSALSNNVWSKYRAAGLQLTIVSSATINSSSTQADEIKAQVKIVYDKILANSKEENGGFDISGQDLSKYATLTNSDKLTKTFKCTDFVSVEGENSNIVVVENTAQLFFVTKATSPYYISKSEGTYKPTRADYLAYLEDSDDVTTATKNCLTTYYIPAINELTSDTIITNSLVEDVIKLLDTLTYTNKDTLRTYLEACKVTEE